MSVAKLEFFAIGHNSLRCESSDSVNYWK